MYEIRGLSSIALFMFVREQCQEKLQSALLFFSYLCSPAYVCFIRTQLDFLFTCRGSCWVLLIWTVMILNVASLCCMCSFVMQGIMLMPALRFKICMYLWRVLIMASYIMHSSSAFIWCCLHSLNSIHEKVIGFFPSLVDQMLKEVCLTLK